MPAGQGYRARTRHMFTRGFRCEHGAEGQRRMAGLAGCRLSGQFEEATAAGC